jgi:hypothetical protein
MSPRIVAILYEYINFGIESALKKVRIVTVSQDISPKTLLILFSINGLLLLFLTGLRQQDKGTVRKQTKIRY